MVEHLVTIPEPEPALDTKIVGILCTEDVGGQGLTNQEIRKKLHQQGEKVTKPLVNTTLHRMKNQNMLQYRQDGTDKRWSCL